MSFQNEFDKNMKKKIEKDAHRTLMKLIKWLYDNHKEVLREWEKTQGNVSIEFLGGEK
jgi:hypothetical protein